MEREASQAVFTIVAVVVIIGIPADVVLSRRVCIPLPWLFEG